MDKKGPPKCPNCGAELPKPEKPADKPKPGDKPPVLKCPSCGKELPFPKHGPHGPHGPKK